MKNRPLTPVEQRQMASSMHVWILDGLANKTPWKLEDVAFQGGTSLALAWDSPRFSEDLDFIARENLNFEQALKKVAQHVENGMQREYPGCKVDMKAKEGERQNVYTFSLQVPNILGKTKVKTEFWKVGQDVVKGYDRQYKMVARRGMVSPQLPVASLDQIMTDKMVAIGARERLKWRDLFDVWFLHTAGQAKMLEDGNVFSQSIEQTLALYNTTPLQLKAGWENFLAMPEEEILAKSLQDLKPFLPQDLWEKLWPQEISTMVELAKQDVKTCLLHWPPQEYLELDSAEFKAKVLANRHARTQQTRKEKGHEII